MSVVSSTFQGEPGSFRDPDTKVFYHHGDVYRGLTARALADWKQLVGTDFFSRFGRDGLIVSTDLVTDPNSLPALDARWVAVLKHKAVPFISYPYEWSFGMLRDAALSQLDLTLAALNEEMILKDATPYNTQWIGARPTFIDIGSFTNYQVGDPWVGYTQFCNQFLYPLFLQAHKNVPFQPWLRGSLEGLDAGTYLSLLSPRDYLRRGVLAHVYLQAKARSRFENTSRNIKRDLRGAGFGAALIKNNIQDLRKTVKRLVWRPERSTWSEYVGEHNYEDVDVQRKSNFVLRLLESRRWSLVWDIGCNVGTFSRMAAAHADYVLALDSDHVVIEHLYDALKQEGRTNILPLLADVAEPSPGLGWRGTERRPLCQRGTPDLIFCLALMHHLVIGRHIPISELVEWLAGLGGDLVIEFVDRKDSQVERLFRNRDEQAVEYSAAALEGALAEHFGAVTRETLISGNRTLYYARRRIHTQ